MSFPILKTATISYENGQKVTLPRMKVTDTEMTFSDGLQAVCLSLEQRGKLTAVYVHTDLTNGHTLDPENAVSLSFSFGDDVTGYMASEMAMHWATPRVDTDFSKIEGNTQALLLHRQNGAFSLLLPVCDREYKTTVSGTEDGVEVHSFSWMPQMNACHTLAFVYGEDKDPYSLMRSATAYAVELMGNRVKMREDRAVPDLFEYLGWCSWDAFHVFVNHQGLLDKCQELKDKNIPVRWALIDDMWADVPNLKTLPPDIALGPMISTMHRSKMRSFEADPDRFPRGLAPCIADIKSKYGLAVGMWHPTTGYWLGVEEDGPIAKQHADCLAVSVGGRLMHRIDDEDKVFAFYDAFHTYLEECGADFIKIDNQSCISSNFKGVVPVGVAGRNLQNAIERSTTKHFGNRLINCMGMGNENYWNRPDSAVTRCSCDFAPENKEWFIGNLMRCCYNSYVQGQLMWCDWDMWWTDDNQAEKNAIAHAISGGPVYLSDELGRSVRDRVMPLVYADGRLLRCDRPAMPTTDCLTVNPAVEPIPFTMWSTVKGCAVIAAFHLYKEQIPVSSTLSVDPFWGLDGDEFVVYEHFSKTAFTVKRGDTWDVTLTNDEDLKLYAVYPINNAVTPIGLTDKYIAPHAVIEQTGNTLTLREGGNFAFYTERPVERVEVNGKAVPFTQTGALYIVETTETDTPMAVTVV